VPFASTTAAFTHHSKPFGWSETQVMVPSGLRVQLWGAAGAYRLGLVRRLPRLLCVALFLTCFTVAGVVNSFNIIDGMNGLASMCAVLMMAALAYIAWRAGDALVADSPSRRSARRRLLRLELPAADLPGDSGAYLLGFAAVELGFALIRRHPAVSPLAPHHRRADRTEWRYRDLRSQGRIGERAPCAVDVVGTKLYGEARSAVMMFAAPVVPAVIACVMAPQSTSPSVRRRSPRLKSASARRAAGTP